MTLKVIKAHLCFKLCEMSECVWERHYTKQVFNLEDLRSRPSLTLRTFNWDIFILNDPLSYRLTNIEFTLKRKKEAHSLCRDYFMFRYHSVTTGASLTTDLEKQQTLHIWYFYCCWFSKMFNVNLTILTVTHLDGNPAAKISNGPRSELKSRWYFF